MRTAIGFMVLLAACSQSAGTVPVRLQPPSQPGASVATFKGGQLTEGDLTKRFADMSPYVRARYQTVEQRREFVEGLLRYELLAREAARRDLGNDPEVVDAFKRTLVQKLLRQEFEEKKAAIPAADVQAYYDKHRSDYVKPAMTRLSHVFIKAPDREKAEAVLKAARALEPLDYAAFAKLAREQSQEPRTAPIEGDLRFLSDEELSTQYGPELAEGAKALTRVGDVLPQLVETKAGYHVIKLQGRQVALNLDLEKVKQSIENILVNERKMERYKDFLAQLFKDADVKVDDAAVARLVVDMKAGNGPRDAMPGPPPFLPPAPEMIAPAPRPEH